MTKKRLNIINIAESEQSSPLSIESSKKRRERELQSKFERLWLTHPNYFDPLRDCMERERLERTWRLLNDHVELSKHPLTVDIGCGGGVFSRRLRDGGARVEAVDIAENALKHFRASGAANIALKRESMPHTSLPDEQYNIVICTEIIAEIPPQEYRVFFAELARIINRDGFLVCSSSIDIKTVGGVERLKELASTEFDIIDEVVSYHALYLKIRRLVEAPLRFAEAWRNPPQKEMEISRLKGWKRRWYRLNTSLPLAWLWALSERILKPIDKLLCNNNRLLLWLEKICRFLSDSDGISHYLFIAKRRSLSNINEMEIPINRLGRKEIWD